jgi:hypothetical protein
VVWHHRSMHTAAALLRAIVVLGAMLVAPACEDEGCFSSFCPIDAVLIDAPGDATDAAANASER